MGPNGYKHSMSAHSIHAKSRVTPGMRGGGGPRPQETPPAEDGVGGTGPRETHNPTKGWAAGPLAAIVIVSVLVALFFLAYAIIIL
ncbi:hypothetical protein Sgou_57340 [Streptomyces gougerotii]|uniref:Uncharacterized protein n=5 Tax=Streptomyces TaxID=1883 RepID=A0ABQ1DEU6_9ACTN|nr:hypothetical protein EES47_28825 [Streptomyces sp. ADI98-12]GFH72265.1 hypothetical protein Sdia_30330 [Streptomyces diastaticus subsp. diastaticus]GFH81064.1 hypothetical protein Sgou_57340 [Streptomyces gougerotii]GGU26923.1 hypothetical protein GCM10015534_31940 [Streptomyces diastaticus subsp. diastaticus]SUP35386.1 membrane protein [Streptomyces griseus]